MVRLEWGEEARLYDNGVDRGVLYLDDTTVPWNGLVSVDEKPTGELNVEHYFDGNRIHISQELGDFEATISAYTYPAAFSEYNGYSPREEYKRFGLSYRTMYGAGYKIHLVYNALIRSDNRSWRSLSTQIEPSLFAWDALAEPVKVSGGSPSAHLILDSSQEPEAFATLEDILYGTVSVDPRLPLPSEIVELYELSTVLRVTYEGDGVYSVTGPDDMVQVQSNGRIVFNTPSLFFLSEDVFVINSY